MTETEIHIDHCLNCGHSLNDRFCSHCGQDSKEFKRSVWKVFFQFFETFTDFDNKLWSSLWPLLFKPGYLTVKYLEGKRKRFLNPIQMYAFFSFIFFLTAFYLPDSDPNKSTPRKILSKTVKEGNADALNELDDEEDKKDSVGLKEPSKQTNGAHFKVGGDTTKANIDFDGPEKTAQIYDSIQRLMPDSAKDGFVKSSLKRKFISIAERFEKNDESLVDEFFDGFKSNLPNVIILLLPLIALVLKILYIRRMFYYVEHLIFAIHIHCFTFLLFSIWLITELIFPSLDDHVGWMFILLFVYVFVAMKRMFSQSGIRTFVKFILFGASYTFLLFVGMVLNFLVSIYLME